MGKQVHILILLEVLREATLDSNVSSRNGKKCESGKESGVVERERSREL